MPNISGARASLDVVGSHFTVGPTVVLGGQAVNLLEGKLSLRRAIFCLSYNQERHLFFIWFVSQESVFLPCGSGGYFLELMVRPNKVIMSTMASFKCFPKRCESVSGLENLEEMWKWMKFSPTIMYETP